VEALFYGNVDDMVILLLWAECFVLAVEMEMIRFKGDSLLTFPPPVITDGIVLKLSLETTQVGCETVAIWFY